MLFTPADKNLICTRLILCRPYGTVPGCDRYPRTSSWATPCRPYGTGWRSALSADLFSANAVHTQCRDLTQTRKPVPLLPGTDSSAARTLQPPEIHRGL